jgi:hypothetical protein
MSRPLLLAAIATCFASFGCSRTSINCLKEAKPLPGSYTDVVIVLTSSPFDGGLDASRTMVAVCDGRFHVDEQTGGNARIPKNPGTAVVTLSVWTDRKWRTVERQPERVTYRKDYDDKEYASPEPGVTRRVTETTTYTESEFDELDVELKGTVTDSVTGASITEFSYNARIKLTFSCGKDESGPTGPGVDIRDAAEDMARLAAKGLIAGR